MGDKRLTFFEFHFDGPVRLGPSFGEDPEPSTDDSTDGTSSATDAGSDVGDESGGEPSGGGGGRLALGALGVLVLTLVAWKLLGSDDQAAGEDSELVDLDEGDDE